MSGADQKIAELERELERARDLALHLAKLAEMGKLVAVVAHELSQPLLGIKAFAQILRRRHGDDDFIGPKIRMIEEQAVHMEGLLDGLRRYSKAPPRGRGRVDVLEPVHTALEIFHERARKQRVDMELQAERDLPQVRGNHGHVQQLLVNLLSNALDELESGRGGRVLLKVEAVPPGVRLRVADTGRGVPADLRERIFEAFYSTKGAEKGTGLGLSICRDILGLHQGTIRLMDANEVEQTFGAGFKTAFEAVLSRAPEEE